MQEKDISNPSKYLVFIQDKRFVSCRALFDTILLVIVTSSALMALSSMVKRSVCVYLALHCGCALSVVMEHMFYACVNVHVGRNQKRVLNHDDEISLATKKNKGWYLQYI